MLGKTGLIDMNDIDVRSEPRCRVAFPRRATNLLPRPRRHSHHRCRASDAQGITIVEVLLASSLVALTVIAVALMLASGTNWVSAGGDNRVAVALAQQKIEQLRSLTFPCVFPGGPQAYPTSSSPLQSGCVTIASTQQYSEGPGLTTWVNANGAQGPQPGGDPTRTGKYFTRKTCVQYVSDSDYNTPAYLGGTNPTTSTCLPYMVNGGTTSCGTLSAPPPSPQTCVITNSKRVVVIVRRTDSTGNANAGGANDDRGVESDAPVVIEAWITSVPGGV